MDYRIKYQELLLREKKRRAAERSNSGERCSSSSGEGSKQWPRTTKALSNRENL
ncbi:conserved hypothetical protein [Ricinus communis]|uniref:Uncharacterized protein n=1 Tax=Ricinus communis TaxID=3988 RepID=B9SBZ3_RICCO|nr:conserved hypothetical protein [Ricinus communis]